jgi:predicted nucleic acid-binding protein
MAVREVFADTSALYALVNRNDAYHEAARTEIARLLQIGRPLVTTDYVIAETLNLANARGGALVADRVLDLVERSQGLITEWVGTDRFDAAKAFFRKHADHAYSFTDCTSFVTMRELKLADVLTTDRHFIEAGFRVLLPTARSP